MKVILNQVVPNLGKKNQVVNVANGYARNYLFPRGFAVVATKGQLHALEVKNARLAAKTAAEKSTAEANKEKIDGLSIKIDAKVGNDGRRLFGAITSNDIVNYVKELSGIEVDKKQIALLHPIKRVGNYKIQIDLHQQVDAFVHLNVVDPNAIVEEAEENKAAEEVVSEETTEEAKA